MLKLSNKLEVLECKTHNYDDLPMKGLGKSMEGVGLNEPVIITQSAGLDAITWGYSKAEIERRAYELNAEVKCMKLPPKTKCISI